MDSKIIIICAVAVVVGFFIGFIVKSIVSSKRSNNIEIEAKNKLLSAENEVKELIKNAENEADFVKQEKIIEAKEEAHNIKSSADEEIKERKLEVKNAENRVSQKEETLDKKIFAADKRHEEIDSKEKKIAEKEIQLNESLNIQNKKLESISGFTQDQAKELLLANVEKQIRTETGTLVRRLEEEAKEQADKTAKEIIIGAIQRTASDVTSENTISVISIPSDDMKGRIIGREGRNIRAIEQATGVDIVIDDTPEAITVSCFDPVRRHIASIAIQKLLADGRIQPAKIEEMVSKAKKETSNDIKEAGEQASFETGVHNIHPELAKLIGRLKFRTSFGQNALRHSIEVSHLAGLMASELGLDPKLAKRAGLLHDIGKAVDHEIDGSHVDIGIDLLKKYKERQEVIDAMASHHGDYEAKNLEAVLIEAADSLSAARPGARAEILDSYVKRIQRLEELVNSTKGIENSYAIQAGREIRVIANPEEVSDSDMVLLTREIAKKIESELKYPGQIKVNMVREKKVIEYAK